MINVLKRIADLTSTGTLEWTEAGKGWFRAEAGKCVFRINVKELELIVNKKDSSLPTLGSSPLIRFKPDPDSRLHAKFLNLVELIQHKNTDEEKEVLDVLRALEDRWAGYPGTMPEDIP